MSNPELYSLTRRPADMKRMYSLAAVAALALTLGVATPAGAAGRAYSQPSCSLAATVTPAGVVFDYDPPPMSLVARNFGLHVVDGPFVGGQTLEAGTVSNPLPYNPALEYEVSYAGMWYRLATVPELIGRGLLDCAGTDETVTALAPPAVAVEPPATTVPPAVEIGVAAPPMTAPPTIVAAEVLSSTVTAARTLPATGRPTGQLAVLGLGLAALGGWTLRTGRRLS